jgi:hypothetical protein
VPAEQVKTTWPVYVPVAKPVSTLELIDTVTLPDVEPLEGATCSQAPLPLLVLAATVYEIAVLVELVTVSVWLLGTAPAFEVKAGGETGGTMEGSDVNVSVTVTGMAAPPSGVTVIVPV